MTPPSKNCNNMSSDSDLSYLPDSISDSSSDSSPHVTEPKRKRSEHIVAEQLASAVGRIINKKIDTTVHGPVMLNREGREKAVEREKYERRLQDAISIERRELLEKGHVSAPISSSDLTELRLVRTAFAGVKQFIDAITGYAEETRVRKDRERETIERLQRQQEALRGTERTRWRTLPEDNLLDEFIRTADPE